MSNCTMPSQSQREAEFMAQAIVIAAEAPLSAHRLASYLRHIDPAQWQTVDPTTLGITPRQWHRAGRTLDQYSPSSPLLDGLPGLSSMKQLVSRAQPHVAIAPPMAAVANTAA